MMLCQISGGIMGSFSYSSACFTSRLWRFFKWNEFQRDSWVSEGFWELSFQLAIFRRAQIRSFPFVRCII